MATPAAGIATYRIIAPKPYTGMSCALLFPLGGKFQLVREFGRNFSSTPRQIFTLSATRGARNPITTLKIFQLVREPILDQLLKYYAFVMASVAKGEC
ncbi:hypothetical protein NIES23_55620 (plasmid) [Trichormus variabilis NIES-23]|uniref:Uncharacterized protein n=1 Tax=Trichormus variabilis NIES-23 TaxID=1973479 RepID=A0A1Z4KUX9_ANAVA|nr:hypothetical protein NIES23_55620 [Trichormus variabilis NIES-23]